MGLPATLNEGLGLARHELVARLDADDEALSTRLRVQRQFMEENPSVAVAGSYVFHMGARREHDRLLEVPATPREVARTLPRENCLYHPSVIMRRSVVLDAGGYRTDFRNAEDYDLWLRLARSYDLANVKQPLLRYRFSLAGATLARKWEQLFFIHLAQELNRGNEIPLEQAVERARARSAAVDRQRFMSDVAKGTAAELARLHLWGDAFRMIRGFSRELGPATTASLTASLLLRGLAT